MIRLDYTGEELETIELIHRLQYRQFVRGGIQKSRAPVDENLNFSVCWSRHEIERALDEDDLCPICKTPIRFIVKAGMLVKGRNSGIVQHRPQE